MLKKTALNPQTPKELLECCKDKWWRLNNLYYIKDEQGNKVLFKLRPVQKYLLENKWWLNIIPKSRQHGITTALCIDFLDNCLWVGDLDAGIIAHTLPDVKKIFRTKVKYAYDNLVPEIRALFPARNDSAHELVFENGSSIYVAASMRSGTLQQLLISEYGKICAKYPEKAVEIQSGALNTLHDGSFVFIESTTEGRGNDFHRRVEEAEKLQVSGTKLTRLDWKLFFFAWWEDKKNAMDPTGIVITDNMAKYFKELKEEHGISLTPGQKAWYVKKEKDQGDLMYREFPSTLAEAFYASQKGTFFGEQMIKARKEHRIVPFIPVVPSIPMFTTWDLGRNEDSTAIWWFQQHRNEIRFLFYHEDTDKELTHYWLLCKELAQEHKFFYDEHYLPHDIEVTDMTAKYDRKTVLEEAGMTNIVTVERVPEKMSGIEAARKVLPDCWFSEQGCDQGIIHLENYKKQYDEKSGCFIDVPFKRQKAAHGADAFMQFAQEYEYEIAYKRPHKKQRSRSWKTA